MRRAALFAMRNSQGLLPNWGHMMVTLIICLVGPLAAAPLIVFFSRPLFAIFVREGAGLFLGLDMHKEWSLLVGKPIAIANAVVFTLAWWAAVGLSAMGAPSFSMAASFIVGLALAMLITYMFVKDLLHLHNGDAWLVGLLAFAGGNLPVIILMPVLLMTVMDAQALTL